jgi:hypothetical protein
MQADPEATFPAFSKHPAPETEAPAGALTLLKPQPFALQVGFVVDQEPAMQDADSHELPSFVSVHVLPRGTICPERHSSAPLTEVFRGISKAENAQPEPVSDESVQTGVVVIQFPLEEHCASLHAYADLL